MQHRQDARCDDHVTKQQAGMLSTVMTADRESGLGKLLQGRMEAHPQSTERKTADAELAQITNQISKRTPRVRHEQRISALYVEPEPVSGKWNRPTTVTSPSSAHKFLQDAVNDYAGRYDQGYITSTDSILKHIDPELYRALEQWSDRPELQHPEWPLHAGS